MVFVALPFHVAAFQATRRLDGTGVVAGPRDY
jgi:hypothetical protein